MNYKDIIDDINNNYPRRVEIYKDAHGKYKSYLVYRDGTIIFWTIENQVPTEERINDLLRLDLSIMMKTNLENYALSYNHSKINDKLVKSSIK